MAHRLLGRISGGTGGRAHYGGTGNRHHPLHRRHGIAARGAGFANLAVPKFGLRALAQSMAREFAPRGAHVAHVIIDGQIESERYRELGDKRGPDSLLPPDAIAETYYQLHRQPRGAWTHELDLRPWVEKF